MGKSLDAAMKEKRELEEKPEALEKDNEALRNIDHDVGTQLCKLRYQNEVNKGQKVSIGRALVQKDIDLKKQELEIEELSEKLREASLDGSGI
jgi:hypothetical protein